jgi:hypothetical protein
MDIVTPDSLFTSVNNVIPVATIIKALETPNLCSPHQGAAP